MRVSSEEQLISSEEKQNSCQEQRISSEEKPFASEATPVSCEEERLSSEELSFVSQEKFSSEEKHISSQEKLFVCGTRGFVSPSLPVLFVKQNLILPTNRKNKIIELLA